MYSGKNSLKVWISNYTYPYMAANTDTLNHLPAGAIGFYTEAGVLCPDGTGTGFIAFRRPDGTLLKSKTFTSATTWLNRRHVYAAPTMETQTIAVTATASTLYQIRIEMKIPGVGGSYIKHGNYMSAASGDTATTIGDALVASLKANFAREEKDYFTITNATGTISIVAKLQPYVRGKLYGKPVSFKTSLIYPEAQAANSTLTVAPSNGYGYAPYIAEWEFFAQGDSDQFRFNGWPNSFDTRSHQAIVDPTLAQYDVANVVVDDTVATANADVHAPQAYMVCFNSIGKTPTPVLTNASLAAGSRTLTGWAVPGSTVTVYDNGAATAFTGTANATTGAVSIATVTVTEAHVYTLRALDGSSTLSAASNSLTATA